MFANSLIEIFERDLTALKKEIESYADESKLWLAAPGISNSAGNLCLHVTGGLRYFIGAVLGQSGYVRDRDAEFAVKDVPKTALVQAIEETMHIIPQALSQMHVSDFDKTFPIEVFKKPMTTEYFLLHLVSHLNYHLGQINYHRRLVAGIL
jgi:uncharacterized damage-inducible protein DinB